MTEVCKTWPDGLFGSYLAETMYVHCRAPIVATWADRFSRCCWW